MGRKSWSEEETTNFFQCIERSAILSTCSLHTHWNGNFRKFQTYCNHLHLDRLTHVFMQRCFYQPWLRSDFIFKLSPLYRLEQRCASIAFSLIDKVIDSCDSWLAHVSIHLWFWTTKSGHSKSPRVAEEKRPVRVGFQQQRGRRRVQTTK